MSNLHIVYGIIIIIIFAIWYYMSKSFISENVKKSCETSVDNSEDIFWGLITRFFTAIIIGYVILIIYSYYSNHDINFY